MDDEFERQVRATELDYRAFLDETDVEYRAMVRDINRAWGTFVDSTKSMWSSYSSDLLSHGEAQFEEGYVTVEMLDDPVRALPDQRMGAILGGQLEAMMSEANPAARNVLEGLVDRGDGTPLTPSHALGMVQGKIAAGEATRRTVRAQDGTTKVVVGLRLPMVPGHLLRAAEPYRTIVRSNSVRFGLTEDVVLAVIHTESYFNPLAKSTAPAYGLMQLVPTTGGRDAWKLVYGTPGTPSSDLLYTPERNVELGCAYIRILLDRHFSFLESLEARYLAAIAGYNAGPGRTRRALGKEIPPGASPERVRSALRSAAPEETRQYIDRVCERRRIWRGEEARR